MESEQVEDSGLRRLVYVKAAGAGGERYRSDLTIRL